MGLLFANAGFMTLWRPEVMLTVVLLGSAYFCLVGPLRSRVADSGRITVGQGTALVLALLVMYVATGSPLDGLAQNNLFSAYIVQMLLMTMLLPQLILIALPAWLLEPVLRVRWLRRSLATATSPFVSTIVYNLIATALLVPVVLGSSLLINWLHIVEQMILMLAAVFLWWPLNSRLLSLPRLGSGGQLIYLLFSFNLMMPLPVLLFLAQHPWYAIYAQAPRTLGISAVADQQLGAILMMVGMVGAYGIRAIRAFSAYAGVEWYG